MRCRAPALLRLRTVKRDLSWVWSRGGQNCSSCMRVYMCEYKCVPGKRVLRCDQVCEYVSMLSMHD